MTFWSLLGVFSILGTASLLTGRLLAATLGRGILLRFSPAAAAASAILGTGTLVFVSSVLSQAGLTAPQSLLALASLLLLMTVACWWRRCLGALVPQGPPIAWLGLLAASILGGTMALLPVLRANGFSVGNDTITYCSFADWFLRNAFSTPAGPDALQPVTDFVNLYQTIGSRLGVTHLLSLCTVASGASTSLLVIPAVGAWGIVLTLLGVYAVACWVLRLPRALALAAVIAYALLPHPLLWGHHNGFLQQAFGDANILLSVAVLTRASRRARWTAGTGALIALLVVCQCYVYLQMLPFVAAAAVWPLWLALRQARTRGASRFFVMLAVASGLSLLGAMSELTGVFWRFRSMLSGVAGWDVELTKVEFLQFASGTLLYFAPAFTGSTAILAQFHQATTPALVLLAGLGLARATYRSRWGSFIGVIATFGSLVAYYGLLGENPWNGHRGHTFNVFKAVQWAYPWVFLLGLAGLDTIRRTSHRLGALLPWMIALLPAALLPVHWATAEQYAQGLAIVLQEARPLEALPDIKRRLESLPPGTLVVLNRPARHYPWLGALAALLANPRSIVGEWDQTIWVRPRPSANEEWFRRLGRPDAIPILVGLPPFPSAPIARLGGPFARVLSLEPFVVDLGGLADRRAALTGQPRRLWLGADRSRIVVFSRKQQYAAIRLRPKSASRAPSPHYLTVVPGDLVGQIMRRAVEEYGSQTVDSPLCLPVLLNAGLSTVVLRPRDQSTAPLVEIEDAVVIPNGECPGASGQLKDR